MYYFKVFLFINFSNSFFHFFVKISKDEIIYTFQVWFWYKIIRVTIKLQNEIKKIVCSTRGIRTFIFATADACLIDFILIGQLRMISGISGDGRVFICPIRSTLQRPLAVERKQTDRRHSARIIMCFCTINNCECEETIGARFSNVCHPWWVLLVHQVSSVEIAFFSRANFTFNLAKCNFELRIRCERFTNCLVNDFTSIICMNWFEVNKFQHHFKVIDYYFFQMIIELC